jgi:glycosyltransferase involved in cell wall biosynthesis
MSAPLVSVTIPCYQQLALAARCIDSVRQQSFRDFELTLLDDGSSEEYRNYVDSLGDSRVSYRSNHERLGAMRNMFQAITFGRARYTLAFHEDDVLGVGYLAAAVEILERYPECGFVVGELRFFESALPDGPQPSQVTSPSFELVNSGADFVRSIFRGTDPMFGSVVYRRAALDPLKPALDEMGTLCDRPFLLSLLKRWRGAVIKEPRVYCRRHDAADGRHESLTAAHVRELLRAYRGALPNRMSLADRRAFSHYTQAWLPQLHRLIPAGRRPPFRDLLMDAWRDGAFDPFVMGLSGARLVVRSLLR